MAAWNSNGSQNSVAHLNPLKGTVLRDSMGGGKGGERGKDLSRDDLVFLLSIMEGELQARDEVITFLKAEKMDLALLEAQYGFLTPVEVLRALQRDSLQAQASEAQVAPQQDVYEKPMVELDRLVETGKQSYRRMLEQLLQVECSHSGALCRLEEQDQQHRAFLQRSDDLTCLLEQDRESRRTTMTIPGIRSGPFTSAEVRSGHRMPTKGTIPGIWSGPFASGEAQEPDEQAEV
ncbi:filamin A-interacting protein 1-like [Oncorhynchus clarkii lewisi]|uniref:filamin A-interacting protein 1-like n=1 Tax=Oncorhynchus clarkii lewisi TaxID=490388 RepID=UPI0039B9435A